MEHQIPSMILLIIINFLIHRRVKVEGNRYVHPIPKMVEKEEMMGAKVVESHVEGDIIDNNL